MSKEGRGQPAHKSAVAPKGLKKEFGNVKEVGADKPHSPGKDKDGLSGYSPGPGSIVPKQAGGKKRHTPGGFGSHHKHDHPMAHHEVHHASHHNHRGHKGHLGEHSMVHSGKLRKRPMGAFRYHEVFDKD